MAEPTQARNRLVDDLERRDVARPEVLDAMRRVERHRFVDRWQRSSAYEDHPLPIGQGQTISQPTIVAVMADAAELTPTDRVLEIGTGSGYGAAVLAELAAEVWTVERYEELADAARSALLDAGYTSVYVEVGDGTEGWPTAAPYDAIVVTAAGPAVPPSLVEQLVDGGRLVMPVGSQGGVQRLVLVRRTGTSTTTTDLGAVRFVPLIGSEGFSDG